MEEIWKDVEEFKGYYEVSNLGRVRTKAIFIPHDGNFNKATGGYIKKHHVIAKGYVNRYGYLHTKLCKLGDCKHRTIHRLVAIAFLENPENYKQVNHIDGDKQNNRVDNLEWVSASQNIRHAYDTGLMNSDHLKGENHYNSKLTEQNVKEIREYYKNKELSQRGLAKKYGVGVTTIADIINNKTWIGV